MYNTKFSVVDATLCWPRITLEKILIFVRFMPKHNALGIFKSNIYHCINCNITSHQRILVTIMPRYKEYA